MTRRELLFLVHPDRHAGSSPEIIRAAEEATQLVMEGKLQPGGQDDGAVYMELEVRRQEALRLKERNNHLQVENTDLRARLDQTPCTGTRIKIGWFSSGVVVTSGRPQRGWPVSVVDRRGNRCMAILDRELSLPKGVWTTL